MRHSKIPVMVKVLGYSTVLFSLCCHLAVADSSWLPVKLTEAQLQGDIFSSALAIASREASELGPNEVEDAEVFLSSDRKLDAGMYRSGATKFTVSEPYGVDEFMYFLEGRVTLTSTDGSVTKVESGEAVTIPKEWTGIWESSAYTKIYVIYSPDTLLPEKAAGTND